MSLEKVLQTAANEVGYLEKASNSQLDSFTANAGRANYTKYGRDCYTLGFFNGSKNGYEWCTSFVAWVFGQVYGKAQTESMLAMNSMSAGCYYWVQSLKAAGQYGSTPHVGDLIFFSDSDGDPCHIGIVYAVDSSTVYTIEGNTSGASGVVSNGGGVAKKSYSRSYSRIHGYGYPKWDSTPSYKVGWNKDETGWWYVHEDGTYKRDAWEKIDGAWYHFDGSGYMQKSQWVRYNNNYYWLTDNGKMAAAQWVAYDGAWYWVDDEGHALHSQWITTNDCTYYLKEDGKMATNCMMRIDEEGLVVPGCAYYHKFGELPDYYKAELQPLVDAGKLKGREGTGNDLVLDMSEDAVRCIILAARMVG